jgi:hypothetical protein
VKKIMGFSVPPAARQRMRACARGGYRRTAKIKRPKLDDWLH